MEISPSSVIKDFIKRVCTKLDIRWSDDITEVLGKMPIVYIGETFQQDLITNKTFICPNVQQTLHVYGAKQDEVKVGKIILMLLKELRKHNRSDGYYIELNDVDQTTVIDRSNVAVPIVDGYVYLNFKLY